MSDIKLEIIKCLIDERAEMILNHIAKKTKRSAQLIEYHIKQLIEKKIVVCAQRGAGNNIKKYYSLTPIFYDESAIEALYMYLTPFVETLSKECPDDMEYIDIVCILGYMLELFISDASKNI
jgi:hypothetical protein